MKLSPHFTLEEMSDTSNAAFHAKNRPPDEFLQRGRVLCETLLEPIRAHYGAPVMVHSGYRSEALNKHIGGSRNSQHCRFEAADFHVLGVDLRKVFDWIRLESGLEWGQLILEGRKGHPPSWIHISLGAPYRAANRCGEVMVFDGEKYTVIK